LSFLAPGDYKVVRDPFAFAPTETMTHEALIQALKKETELKIRHLEKKIVGF